MATGVIDSLGVSAGAGQFPSPFVDMAGAAMPRNNRDALLWCEHIFNVNGTYRAAQERILSYFMTDIEINSADDRKALGDDEKTRWSSFLYETLSIREVVQQLNIDKACYGNAFASVIAPFIRHLKCQDTGEIMAFRVMANDSRYALTYDSSNVQFRAKSPKKNWQLTTWVIYDQPDDLDRKLKIKIWSPHEIEIRPDFWTGDCEYIWKIPSEYKREIKRGNMHMLERAPHEVLKAISIDGWFLFAKDAVFHLKESTLSGIKTRGWGISKVMINFRDIWYVQVLRRYNEAIALDYVIPFRLLTPAARGGRDAGAGAVSDPLRMMNMGSLRGQLEEMLRRRRKDPAAWHTLPFPIEYQALGGDARMLTPSELLDQGYDTLLNAAGTPAEMYRGTLQLQVAPVALRLFEATHISLVNGNNMFLRWLVRQVAPMVSLPVADLKFKRVTYADDYQRNMAALQLFMGQQLSGTTALGAMGYDWREEMRRIGEETGYQQRLQAELQKDMETEAFGEAVAMGGAGQAAPAGQAGAAPAGMAPQSPVSSFLASQGPNSAISLSELEALAESLAQQLLGLPESQKLSEMRALKEKHQTLHSLVKAKLEQIRNQARTSGASMLLGQQPAAV